MISTKVQTKKNETVITTSDTSQMHKKYLANNLFRTWTEQYVDSDTGKIIEVERSELVLERGTYLDVDQLAVIQFHLQAGDVKEVTVSNQKRLGHFGTGREVIPWQVTVQLDKKYKVILLARNIFQALDIVEDWAEIKFDQVFSICSAKEFKKHYFIFDDDVRLVLENGVEIPEDESEEIKHAVYSFYSVEVNATLGEDNERYFRFLVYARDVDNAKVLIEKFLRGIKDTSYADLMTFTDILIAEHLLQIKVMSATKVKCHSVIGLEFTRAYNTNQEEEPAEEEVIDIDLDLDEDDE